MGKYPVRAEKEAQLLARMDELDIREEDIEEKFIRGSGKGGQKINKTSSCVYLLHQPSGIEIKCQQDRSQAMNRFIARRELCERVAEQVHGEKTRKQQEAEKIRRQKRRRSRRAKEQVLQEKHKVSKKKADRRGVGSEEQDS